MPEELNKYITFAKNKLASDGAWLWLLDLQIEGEPTLHFVNNIEDITYGGTLYHRCNFQMGSYDKSEPNRLSEVDLSISNADLTRFVMPYVDAYDGLIGSIITRTPVHSKHLTIDMSAMAEDFVITGCSAMEEWIAFTLGAPSLLNRKFPEKRYFSHYCRYVGKFKEIECAYAGAATTCNGTPEACEDKNNLERFGGQPGLRSKTVRFA